MKTPGNDCPEGLECAETSCNRPRGTTEACSRPEVFKTSKSGAGGLSNFHSHFLNPDRENEESALTGSVPLSDTRTECCFDLSLSLKRAPVLQNSHLHLFTINMKLPMSSRYCDYAAISPGLVSKHFLRKTLTINHNKNSNKDDITERETKISAILSEMVTEFLLLNVWEGEFLQLRTAAVAVSWREDLASLARVSMYVRVTVSLCSRSRESGSALPGLEKPFSSLDEGKPVTAVQTVQQRTPVREGRGSRTPVRKEGRNRKTTNTKKKLQTGVKRRKKVQERR